MPLDTNDSEVTRIRHVVWEAMTAIAVPANLSTEHDVAQASARKTETTLEDTTGLDRTLIEMWNKGYSRDEIANRVKVSKDRVTNSVTELRNKFGENIVPIIKIGKSD